MKCKIYFLIFLLFLSSVCAEPLTSDSSNISFGCDSCACAIDTCIGSTCVDDCGDTCYGTKRCGSGGGGSSTPSFSCDLASECVANPNLEGCSYDGCNYCCDSICTFNICETEIVEEVEEVIEEPIEEEVNETIEEPIEEPEVSEEIKEEFNWESVYPLFWVFGSLLILGILVYFLGPIFIKIYRKKEIKKRLPFILVETETPKPIVFKHNKTYPEIEALKKRMAQVDTKYVMLFKDSADQYYKIAKMKLNLTQTSRKLMDSYISFNKRMLFKK